MTHKFDVNVFAKVRNDRFFSLFNFSQEIQTKDLRLEKIKLLSKLEKCKEKEGPRDSQDRVLNGFSKKIILSC